jgi:hypothetical protein
VLLLESPGRAGGAAREGVQPAPASAEAMPLGRLQRHRPDRRGVQPLRDGGGLSVFRKGDRTMIPAHWPIWQLTVRVQLLNGFSEQYQWNPFQAANYQAAIVRGPKLIAAQLRHEGVKGRTKIESLTVNARRVRTLEP